MIYPYKGYVIVQPITNKVSGFEIVGATQTLLSGKVVGLNIEIDDKLLSVNDTLVFDMTESFEYTFEELGKVIIVPEKAIVAVDHNERNEHDIVKAC